MLNTAQKNKQARQGMRAMSIFILLAFSPSLHSQILCLPNKPFVYPEIAVRAGIQPTFRVQFDITGFSPVNIVFPDSANNNEFELFRPAILKNLGMLHYLKDTANFSLTIVYEIRPTMELSNSFAELRGDNELHIVARKSIVQKIADGSLKMGGDPSLDSVFIESTVEYTKGPAPHSDILVERVFSQRGDYTMILRNNYPRLENEIRSIAKQLSKEHFTGRAPHARYFFVRFRVKREVAECGCTQIF